MHLLSTPIMHAKPQYILRACSCASRRLAVPHPQTEHTTSHAHYTLVLYTLLMATLPCNSSPSRWRASVRLLSSCSVEPLPLLGCGRPSHRTHPGTDLRASVYGDRSPLSQVVRPCSCVVFEAVGENTLLERSATAMRSSLEDFSDLRVSPCSSLFRSTYA